MTESYFQVPLKFKAETILLPSTKWTKEYKKRYMKEYNRKWENGECQYVSG
jgi:hypothetical protein